MSLHPLVSLLQIWLDQTASGWGLSEQDPSVKRNCKGGGEVGITLQQISPHKMSGTCQRTPSSLLWQSVAPQSLHSQSAPSSCTPVEQQQSAIQGGTTHCGTLKDSTSGQCEEFSPTMNTQSLSSAALSSLRQESSVCAKGFSSRTCLPASRHCTA